MENIEETKSEGENNNKSKVESFIEKFRLKEYNSQNYLISPFRFSILEKVITRYLFQNSGSIKDFSLYPYSEQFIQDKDSIKIFINFLNIFIEGFSDESPLYFFNQISKGFIQN